MLGIPVAWLSTLVWSIAAALSFLALFLRAGILGVPLGAALSLQALVLALAALVLGRLRDLPTIIGAAVALGILEYGVSWNASSPLLVTPIIGAAVLIALLLQRRQYGRTDRDEAIGWRLADEIRPLQASARACRSCGSCDGAPSRSWSSGSCWSRSSCEPTRSSRRRRS
jgi:branched-chain amino acid transport system permease protein